MERWTCVLLTYLLHSTLLLCAALAARLVLRERRLALQEALLRAALAGGFVTAGLQVGLGLQPLAGAWTLAPAVAPAASAQSTAEARAVPSISLPAPPPARPAGDAGEPARSAVHAAWLTVWPPSRAPLALLWIALASLALARVALGAVRLRHLLVDRRPLAQPELGVRIAGLAAGLGLRPPLRVSTAARLTVPLATGILKPEVCLPPRALLELPLEEQTALCAHELAHVARRDPAWLLFARLIEALAPVQPLNAWARRRLQDLAECLSDDLAVRATGRPLGLARSLVDVASWSHSDFTPVTAPGAQGARSRLGHRVERLMDPVRTLERPARVWLPVAGALVLATALLTPVVSSGDSSTARRSTRSAQAEPPPAVPAVPAVPAAPAVPAVAAIPAVPAVPPVQAVPETPVAPPAPAAPAAPVAPVAPPAPARDDDPAATDAQRRLESLTRRIEERARRHSAEMARTEAEIQALTSRLQPHEKDLERLGAELEAAARDVAEAALERDDQGRRGEQAAAARARVQQLREQVRALVEATRLPQEEVSRLSEQARSLAEAARPSDEELAELRSLARELARELGQVARETEREARQAMRRAAEEMKESRPAREERQPSQDEEREPPRRP